MTPIEFLKSKGKNEITQLATGKKTGEFIVTPDLIQEYADQECDIIAFGMYLSGHDRETVEQIYKDWK
jgi:hypothetical protein